MKTIRIACRDSLLAIAQAHTVMQAIREYDPLVVPELTVCKTPADKLSHLPKLPANLKRAHLPVLEEQLRSGKADLVVHSLKDLSFDDDPQFPIMAVGRRGEPGDALVIPSQCKEPNLNRPVGVSCRRRRIQMASLYPGWETKIVNGDIQTRLSVLDSGVYGGLIISADSLAAVRQQERIFKVFPTYQMVPSCCQGIIALQGRRGESVNFLTGFHNVDAWDMALAERAFGKAMGGKPNELLMAAVSTVKEDKLTIHGLLIDSAGKMWEGILSGRREDAVQIGAALATRLKLDAAGPRPRRSYQD